jgi:PPOX class probable F420-dependent enzyme
MLDTSTPAGARAAHRLAEEKIAWLTTVRRSGLPQTSPVWFLFREGEFIVYSKAGTARTANIETNPRVSLNLDGNGRGGDIVVVEGVARIDPAAPPSSAHADYQDKYRGMIDRHGWTPDSFAADYPVPIRIRPTRFRVW